MDLVLQWDGRRGVRRGIEDALRSAIRTGRLRPGARLPSSRTLAADLEVSRNTVADAYAQLISEGYLEARVGAGTRVTELGARTAREPTRSAAPAREESPRYDFTPGRADVGIFPRREWCRAVESALGAAPVAALSYGDPQGCIELRSALAGYLGRTRGVVAGPDDVLVCTGFTQAIALLARVHPAGYAFALENPSLTGTSRMLTREGLRPHYIPVDSDGAQVDLLTGDDRTLLITPAHQFPMGVALSPERRSAVLNWARRTRAVIVEDDYDGEFRYDREPVAALQGHAPDSVVYVGTASKSLAPGLRLGWMVVPPRLRDRLVAEKAIADRHTPVIDQLALAAFIESGQLDRHVRKARRHYATRRQRLLDELSGHPCAVTGMDAGLHVVIGLDSVEIENAVVAMAGSVGLGITRLRDFSVRPAETDNPADVPAGIVVGYGTPMQHSYRAALGVLRKCIAAASGG